MDLLTTLHLNELATQFGSLDDTLRAAIIGAVVFLGVLWVGLVIWTARDIARRTTSTIARVVAVLLVIALHLFGLFIYLLFRPTMTLMEREELALEQDLLRQVSQAEEPPVQRSCETCGTVLAESFRFCPECKREVRRPCRQCKALMELSWKNCAFCGKGAASRGPA